MGRYTYGYPPSAWAEHEVERTRTRSSKGTTTLGVRPTVQFPDTPRHSFAEWGRPVTAPARSAGGHGGHHLGHGGTSGGHGEAYVGHVGHAGHQHGGHGSLGGYSGSGHGNAHQGGRLYFADGTAGPAPSPRGTFQGTTTKGGRTTHRRTGASYPTAIGPFGDASETLYRGLNGTMDAETIRRTDPWGEAGLGQHAVPGSSTVKLVGSRWRYMAPPVRQWVAY